MTKHKQTTKREALRLQLGMSVVEWRAVRDAARDSHMPVRDYCRLMVLAAAGMGGVTEHLERAISASWEADKGGPAHPMDPARPRR